MACSSFIRRQMQGQFRRKFLTKVFIVIFLCLYLLVLWRESKELQTKLKEVAETVTIYHQMQSYAQTACTPLKSNEANSQAIHNKEVDLDEVTLIFVLNPDLSCANSRLNTLRRKYPKLKTLTVFESTHIDSQQLDVSTFSENLGGFVNYQTALQSAISRVQTPYFIVVNSQLSLDSMQGEFIAKLLRNIVGFDVLGGADLDNKNIFHVACARLVLRNWTFFESLEYKIVGNKLHCDYTSQQFLARTESFKKVLKTSGGFDADIIGPLWWQDFLLRVKGLLVVGTLPEVVFQNTASCSGHTDQINVGTNNKPSKKQIDSLLPFVNKHHVLNFVNQDGMTLTICDGSDPLICSEKYIFPQWKLRHWAYSGLTAFPFIVERLIDALHFGTRQLEKAGIEYVLEGGTVLGFVKIQAVLPWDSGDVDTFVFESRRGIINLVRQIQREHGYEYKLRYNAFHVYVTPYYPTHDGLIVYAASRKHPGQLVKVRMHDRLFPVSRNMFRFLRELYGSSYLESRIRFGDERVSCDYEGYQACMPDCRWDGCGAGKAQFLGILL